ICRLPLPPHPHAPPRPLHSSPTRRSSDLANLPRVPQTEYLVSLSRAGRPRQGYAWPVSLRDRLPVVAVPLRGDDPDVPLDLQARSEEHTSELQSLAYLVCRLLLGTKNAN